MRGIERTLGLLSGALGLAALAVMLSQHTLRSTVGTVVYGPGIGGITTTSVLLSAGLAVAAPLLVALAAWQDAHRSAAGLARGGWRWLMVPGAALSVVGVYLLILSNLWVALGVSASGVFEVEASAALLFAPAALAAILCAVVALLPSGQRQEPALA